jgi:hypothetical protein
MRRALVSLGFIGLAAIGISTAQPEGDAPVSAVAELSDPAAPCRVYCSLPKGGISVRVGEDGQVTVTAQTRTEAEPVASGVADAGLKRIPVASTELMVEEAENVIHISTHAFYQPVDVSIAVPRHTSLELRTSDAGDIEVVGISGEIDVECRGGAVILRGVSGAVMAHSLQGDITAEIIDVEPRAPMSFSSLNGDLDISLPAGVKAALRIKSPRGEVYSDFHVENISSQHAAEAPARDEEGVFRAHVERVFSGEINGGGPEYQFHAYHGVIYIRRGE